MATLDPDYQKAVDLLNHLDAEAPAPGFLDVASALAEPQLITTYSYDEAASTADRLLSGTPRTKERRTKAAPHAPAVSKDLSADTKKAEGELNTQLSNVSSGGGFGSSAMKVEQEFTGLFSAAKKEIDSAVGRVKIMVHGKFVLESLSIQDQTAELERISVGLDEHAFNEGNLRIVRQEVQALTLSLKGSHATTENSELVEIRNRRLAEVQQKLNLMN